MEGGLLAKRLDSRQKPGDQERYDSMRCFVLSSGRCRLCGLPTPLLKRCPLAKCTCREEWQQLTQRDTTGDICWQSVYVSRAVVHRQWLSDKYDGVCSSTMARGVMDFVPMTASDWGTILQQAHKRQELQPNEHQRPALTYGVL